MENLYFIVEYTTTWNLLAAENAMVPGAAAR
jgi:hypothetical protein